MTDQETKEPIVSHGRGGQGNIGADSTKYVDGEIVRSGPTGDQGDGAYSAGRGGAGNIGSPRIRPSTPGTVHDAEVIPDLAVRNSSDGDYHIGRGGQGNVHLDESHKKKSSVAVEGLADKLKNKILGKK
ncbi:hypothetical protein BGW36DRAFT_214652 [Talaromyces proteolyticus]|uniref:Uncharacterized protein n=1 Tax=Talaromyces proteolyticus TaxID=1131652 RepID=A0AAD4KQT4_9EURO|nr:uncharacterized protein BGW36DRAFT_214652 [Talaromyces proteolyticus]KAH8694034.1 hypothetical protein BGW36DRAFT_214652 [Talaromyces proteolyticus]